MSVTNRREKNLYKRHQMENQNEKEDTEKTEQVIE